MKYQITRVVDAIQFTGAESVAAIQVFMAPNSPCFNVQAKYVRLAIDVPNPEEDQRWPTMGPHYKLAFLQEGDWIIKDAHGTFEHVTKLQFEAGAVPLVEPNDVPIAIPPAAPMEHLDVAAEIAARNAQDVIDPDPTMPIDASAAQASPAAAALRAVDRSPIDDDEIPL